MPEAAETRPGGVDEDARARVRRTALIAVALTPGLLYAVDRIGLARRRGAVLAAIGAVLGIGVFLVADGSDLGDAGPVTVTVAAIVSVAVATAGIYLFVPPTAMPSLGVGTLTFVWGMVLAGVVRHYVLADRSTDVA